MKAEKLRLKARTAVHYGEVVRIASGAVVRSTITSISRNILLPPNPSVQSLRSISKLTKHYYPGDAE
jgi:hypothetical protein